MKILFTFPGQGTQRAGMLQQLPQDSDIMSRVRAVLGDETDSLDSPDALKHTRAVQLCLLIAGVAWAQELERNDVVPDMVAGLSIGAFPAAVVAGALGFEDALRLVALRGDLMEQAYPHGYGLTAITGLQLGQVEQLVEGSGTYIANINAEQQIVIAGRDEEMASVAQKALAKGAQKAKRLAVSVPSHCELLSKPALKLQQAFADVTLNRPRSTYLSGSTGRVLWQPEQIADDLALNMSRTVRWRDAMVAANERDVRLAIEMPPGSVLTGLTRQAFREGDTLCRENNSVGTIARLAQRVKAAR
ncbi:malonate decarboxylase subunit epsilon [Enterobacteriaceae bacterium H11S18]|uniref:malonate decarboxylase subunit epsilon n=1 Tax=Dryocola clanedunensis TaxID=2925396 RepID=UPI0022F0D397|nr:malonate decarboxylase subunit epsilon [Dryocola clanedunensis]MCT4707880.1 malonate decarboxylase subunit epsilon [Dryocola clanedunensis]MCT4711273.1 malonate decarboxylase subunit epsilon [Dryocola clanedunensis]